MSAITKAAFAVAGSLATLFGLVLYQILLSPNILESVTIDSESKWSRDWADATGIPVIKVVERQRNNRRLVDRVAVVGVGREADWFSRYGYEIDREEQASGRDVAYTETLLEADEVVDATWLDNEAYPNQFFAYLPKAGLLITSSGE